MTYPNDKANMFPGIDYFDQDGGFSGDTAGTSAGGSESDEHDVKMNLGFPGYGEEEYEVPQVVKKEDLPDPAGQFPGIDVGTHFLYIRELNPEKEEPGMDI